MSHFDPRNTAASNQWRWFYVVVTRSMNSETMEFDMECRVRVWATDAGFAMRKVRPEFRGAHLRVEE